jgi:rfaE bifunctional protein nucleotidyltransferase chain/domain
MSIAIDYDNTITKDVGFWKFFISDCISFGKNPIIVSCRTDNKENRKEIASVLFPLIIPILLTSHQSKIDFAKRVGYDFDIWVDDSPKSILYGEPERLRVVFTNGCFDLLHVGHIKTLEFAKSQGDYLIVGLNSDESVKRLKGSSRPIINQEDRKKMLLSLSCVDEVIIFDEPTANELIRRISPNVYVKGLGSKIIEEEISACQFCHCEHIFSEIIDGISTTEINKKIKSSLN